MRTVLQRDVDMRGALHHIDGRDLLYILLTHLKYNSTGTTLSNQELPRVASRRQFVDVRRQTPFRG